VYILKSFVQNILYFILYYLIHCALGEINLTIRSRRWKWIGHTLRKATNNITKQALEWNPQGKRKRGRPKNSWRRGIISELQAINTTWGEAKRKAQDRTRWTETVDALCPL
jgi:hypothetical protein